VLHFPTFVALVVCLQHVDNLKPACRESCCPQKPTVGYQLVGLVGGRYHPHLMGDEGCVWTNHAAAVVRRRGY
jgi:hypothetical protein